jgi:hypothetical protein
MMAAQRGTASYLVRQWDNKKMSTVKKLMMTAAGGEEALAIEDVFSTYLYAGNQTVRTITNGIDLAGHGGLTWITPRTVAAEMQFIDSERGVSPTSTPVLISSLTNGQINRSGAVTAYNSDGFDLGTYDATNYTGRDMVSWTFRKAPRFFDVVTYTGDGTSSRAISHNLGVVPGCIIIKNTSLSANWVVHHRSLTAMSRYLELNNANAEQFDGDNFKATSDTTFTVGPNSGVNRSGDSFVAYLFAHDPLGPSEDGSDGLIACGSFIGTTGTEVNLGWEPQWLLVKDNLDTGYWTIVDNMRGWTPSVDNNNLLYPNRSQAESQLNAYIDLTSTGFKARALATGRNYIYIAIRRGPMRVPESGTEVFAIDTSTLAAPVYTSGFPVDFAITKQVAQTFDWASSSRLTQGKILYPNLTAAEVSNGDFNFAFNDGWFINEGTNSNRYSWMFRRAPGFFDMVAYTGNGTAGRTVPHNLGVAPEMMIVKSRSNPRNWGVMPIDATKYMYINQDIGALSSNSQVLWFNTQPSDSIFTLGNDLTVNGSGWTYIAYLFATLAGVSKVGSYTGTGTHDEHVIDCGFTSGARFVLLKRTDAVSDWFVWDSVRGITTGADPRLSLNTTAAEYNGLDDIHPHPSGFIAANPNGSDVNALNSQWIFYAIA